MQVDRHQGDGTVCDKAVKRGAGDGLAIKAVSAAIGHQKWGIGVGGSVAPERCTSGLAVINSAQIQMRQLRPAQHQMQVAFDKAGQDRGGLVIGDNGLRPGHRQHRGSIAHGADLVGNNCHRLCHRLDRVHRQDPAQQDQVGKHDQASSPA